MREEIDGDSELKTIGKVMVFIDYQDALKLSTFIVIENNSNVLGFFFQICIVNNMNYIS